MCWELIIPIGLRVMKRQEDPDLLCCSVYLSERSELRGQPHTRGLKASERGL